MKSTAEQENNLNFKKDNYFPQNVQTLAPGVCNIFIVQETTKQLER